MAIWISPCWLLVRVEKNFVLFFFSKSFLYVYDKPYKYGHFLIKAFFDQNTVEIKLIVKLYTKKI